MLKIAPDLEADSILNCAGRKKYHTSEINQILRYEKFIGDALFEKTYITDYFAEARVKNHGIVPQYNVENTGLSCYARTVQESQIERALVTAINQTLRGKRLWEL